MSILTHFAVSRVTHSKLKNLGRYAALLVDKAAGFNLSAVSKYSLAYHTLILRLLSGRPHRLATFIAKAFEFR